LNIKPIKVTILGLNFDVRGFERLRQPHRKVFHELSTERAVEVVVGDTQVFSDVFVGPNKFFLVGLDVGSVACKEPSKLAF
jgi:hypothetical protein